MSWVSPRTWVAGEVPTAALFNTHIRDNFLETAPAKATANGDLFYATGPNAITRQAIGGTGAILQVSGGVPSWSARPAWHQGNAEVDAVGDLLVGSGNDALARLAMGSADQYLQVKPDGSNLEWRTSATVLTSANAALGADLSLTTSMQDLASVSCAAGTWLVTAHLWGDNAATVDRTITAEIHNNTDTAVISQVKSISAANASVVPLAMALTARFTLAATKTIALRARVNGGNVTAKATNSGCFIVAVLLS